MNPDPIRVFGISRLTRESHCLWSKCYPLKVIKQERNAEGRASRSAWNTS